MKYKKIKLSVALSLGLCSMNLKAQEVISASGGNALGGGGSASYTVGQIVYTTNTGGANGSVAQGVQQPFEISVVTELEGAKDIILQYAVYPNPATDHLILKIEGIEESEFIVSLYDLNGKLLLNKKTDGSETKISMENLPASIYFLKVVQTHHASSQEIKSFKIIKK